MKVLIDEYKDKVPARTKSASQTTPQLYMTWKYCIVVTDDSIIRTTASGDNSRLKLWATDVDGLSRFGFVGIGEHYIYIPTDDDVVVYDIETLEYKDTLQKHCLANGLLYNSNNNPVVTLCSPAIIKYGVCTYNNDIAYSDIDITISTHTQDGCVKYTYRCDGRKSNNARSEIKIDGVLVMLIG